MAFKPHNGRVTAMAVDAPGAILATGSDDHTVFFLSIATDYEPIGFIQTPSPVTHMEWSPAEAVSFAFLLCLSFIPLLIYLPFIIYCMLFFE